MSAATAATSGTRLREILRFELAYQARRPSTWIYVVALLALTVRITTESYVSNAHEKGYDFNAPFVVATMTLLSSIMALLATAALAGDAAARDVQTRMHPLLWTAPVREGAWLGGRFLAAFLLGALILAGVQPALLLTTVLPGVPAEIVGPFRPGAYMGAYLVIALPNAFIATALLFSMAALSRRAIAGYLGAVLLFFTSMLVWRVVAIMLGHWELAKLLDPTAITAFSEISRTTTAAQKNALSLLDARSLLWNRVAWIGVAVAALAFTRLRFRFGHEAPRARWRGALPWARAEPAAAEPADVRAGSEGPLVVPRAVRRFGRATRLRQVAAVAARSFREIALSWGGLVLVALSLTVVVFGPQAMEHIDIPMIPTTQQMTAFVGNDGEILWTIVPLLTVFYAGELVWREREIGLSEIMDAEPVPEWVRLLGKYAGLALVLAGYQLLLALASMLVQVQLGYHQFEPGLYARTLLGIQLAEHLLFAALALAVHVLVNQKYVGYLVILAAYAFTAFAPTMGVEHRLLVWGADPGWTYTDMRGFGRDVAPWAWFQLYWGGWALLLAVATKLAWVHGREQGVAARLRLARARWSRPTIGIAAVAAALLLAAGGVVFHNTNVLNAYETSADRVARRVEYERRYARFAGSAQPRVTATSLRIELHPERGEAEIRGSHRLVNASGVAIDSLHLAPQWLVETDSLVLDRPATLALDDARLGHRVYVLGAPLLPGDSLRIGFVVRFRPRGFTNDGVDASVTANGTFFEANEWLPAIGYQRQRELANGSDRRANGLPPRRTWRPLEDVAARHDMAGAERVAFEAVVGTSPGQVAVAPGALRRTWREGGRRYFDYATDVPIRPEYAIYSADYAVREARWVDPARPARPVTIQVLHHPTHRGNVDRMLHAARASLDHLTRTLGPYEHGQLRVVERPGRSPSLHAYPVNVSYEEELPLLDVGADPRDIDFPFAVVAHEMAHQWWGNQLSPARVEGAALLSESLAWYSALGVVESAHGRAHLERLLGLLREAFLEPHLRAAPPLLRASNWLHAYRKGPFAMYALREYVGAARVDTALRRLLERHRDAAPPLPTSLDLYRELQAVTPDSLRPLLADLFEANTFWELETTRATAEPDGAGAWRVTLDVRAHKVVIDTTGASTPAPMDDLVEVGVFAAADDGGRGHVLYRRLHRLRAGEQRITVTVPRAPAHAGIDPRALLIDDEMGDNVVATSVVRRP